MSISCRILRDYFATYPLAVQMWLRELARDREFLPCPSRYTEKSSGMEVLKFRQVPARQCEKCRHGYWRR